MSGFFFALSVADADVWLSLGCLVGNVVFGLVWCCTVIVRFVLGWTKSGKL